MTAAGAEQGCSAALDEESRRLLGIVAAHSPRPGMPAGQMRASALTLARLLQGEAPQGVATTDMKVPGEVDVPVRVYRPGSGEPGSAEPASGESRRQESRRVASSGASERGCLVWLHGGGFTTGGLDTHDTLCRRLTAQSGQVVVSVDYRLAPEHRYPAALDDSYLVARWAADQHALLGFADGRLAVGGSSAGGNLAAAVCLLARDRGAPGIVHQTLVYPCVDATMDSETYRRYASGYQLTSEMMAEYLAHYVPPGADRRDPYLSPLWASSLHDLPPAHVLLAELDPLRGEGERYASRLRSAGVAVEVTRFDGVMHGFFGQAGALTKARQAQALACAIVRAALAGPAA